MNAARLKAHEALKARRFRMANPPPRLVPPPAPVLPMVRMPPPPEPDPVPRTPLARVVDHVARYYDVRVVELKGDRKDAAIMLPRHVAMALCSRVTGRTLSQVAGALGRVNHTTVMCALRRVEARCVKDPAFAAEFAALEDEVRAALEGEVRATLETKIG